MEKILYLVSFLHFARAFKKFLVESGSSLDTALHLAHYFGTREDYYINLQQRVSLEAEKQNTSRY